MNITIGIFASIKDLPKKADEGNRAIILGSNTYEFKDGNWIDMGQFILPIGLPGRDGRDAINGVDGVNGKDGVDGKDGKDGKNGENGKDGTDGKDGKDGINGENGKNGKDGDKGEQGEKGINGKDGEKGEVGMDGKDGKDGVDGKDGKDAKEVNIEELTNKCVFALLGNQEFVYRCKGKDGENGMNGANGQNATSDRFVIGFSMDGQSRHLGKQEGDKFISLEVNNSGKNIFQLLA